MLAANKTSQKKIWYVNKYGGTPYFESTFLRQYYLSKWLARNSYKVKLVFSKSSPMKQPPSFWALFKSIQHDGFDQVILNGPEVKLGFGLRRIISWIWFEFAFFIWSLTRRERPDYLIVSSLSILTLYTGIILSRIFHCRLIVEIRDIYPLTLTEVGNFKRNHFLIRVLASIERKAYRNADSIISTLEGLEKHIQKVSPGNEHKFTFIPMGVDPTSLKTKSSLQPRPDEDKFMVGYAGSFGKSQATLIIFQAIKALSIDSNIHFLLIGDGPEKASGLKLVRGCENFTDYGSVPKSRVHNYLQQCDILLNPWLDLPIYQFGISPNKWMDYMLSSRPFILCFNGKPSILQEAGCAFFVSAENSDRLVDKIRACSKLESSILNEMGRKGYNYLANNLSYKSLGERLARTLEGNV